MLAEPGKPPRRSGRGPPRCSSSNRVTSSSRGRACSRAAIRLEIRAFVRGPRFDRRAGPLFPDDGLRRLRRFAAGTIVFQPHEDVSRLTWFDRAGGPRDDRASRQLPERRDRSRRAAGFLRSRAPRRRHDGRLVVESLPGRGDAGRERPRDRHRSLPVPGGNSLVYSSTRGGAPELFRRNLDGGGEEHLTQVRRSAYQLAQDLSPDGRTLAYIERQTPGVFDVWTVPVSGEGRPVLSFSLRTTRMTSAFRPTAASSCSYPTNRVRARSTRRRFPAPAKGSA